MFIGAGLKDNPYLDADEYIQALNELDPVTREQLLNGNWDIKEAGDMFSRHWFNIVPFSNIPETIKCVRYWDMAATDPKKRKSKDKRDPDWTVGFKLGFKQGIYWIMDIARVQKSPADVENLIRLTAEADGHSCAIRMEQEPGSSGVITIDKYAREVLQGYDFQGVLSTGSKVERARAASSSAQIGNVLISDKCRNITAFFDEMDVFPFGNHDDTVDGFSGAHSYFRKPALNRVPTGLGKTNGSYWNKI